MRNLIATSFVVSLCLLACQSPALAECTDYMSGLINFANRTPQAHLQVRVAIKQGNGLSAASTVFYTTPSRNVPLGAAEIDWSDDLLQGSSGKMLYSDRFTNGTYGNPYSINAADDFSIYVNADGHVWIYNQTWGTWTDFQAECQNDILFGWGSPIGLNNGSDPAMYMIAFKKIRGVPQVE